MCFKNSSFCRVHFIGLIGHSNIESRAVSTHGFTSIKRERLGSDGAQFPRVHGITQKGSYEPGSLRYSLISVSAGYWSNKT